MLLFKPASIQAWLGKLASASLASLSLTSAMALLPHGHILPSLSHPGSGSRWGACRRWRLLEGLYSGFKWAQTLLCSLASPPPSLTWGDKASITQQVRSLLQVDFRNLLFPCEHCLCFHRYIMQWGLCYSCALDVQRTHESERCYWKAFVWKENLTWMSSGEE